MRFLVIRKDKSAFWTNYYNYENLWNDETIHCVINIVVDKVSFNGKDWQDVEYDHL